MPRVPLPCPDCAKPMNCHAERLVEPNPGEEVDVILGAVLEVYYQCAVCGRIESRRLPG